jgi:hypothetical protein
MNFTIGFSINLFIFQISATFENTEEFYELRHLSNVYNKNISIHACKVSHYIELKFILHLTSVKMHGKMFFEY